VRKLSTHFFTEDGVARAVNEVSFDVPAGKTVALVGESGCGKSVTAYSILGLITPPGKIVSGEVLFDGVDISRLDERDLRAIRGNKISMIFQEPTTSLNPVFTVGTQIGESLRLHRGASRAEARAQAIDLLRKVKIPAPESRVDEYPHQLSGGMKQRVMIAMALAGDPRVLIADEPTTALDVTIQAQILDLLRDLQATTGMSILWITHDLGVVAEIADEVVVMYASRVVERAPVGELFERPLHPYTQGLFQSLPRMGQAGERLAAIPGTVPSPLALPSGCKFHPRCSLAVEACKETEPRLREVSPEHFVACDVIEGSKS
jgi:peptide/nickel transport system ATP-binding protein/oligopeptide transport system ATP-binding protein